MTEVKIKSRPHLQKKIMETAPDLLSMALWALASFAAAKVSLFGSLAPFGASAVAATKRNYVLASTAGAIMGYIFTEKPENAMRYIAAVLVGFASKLLFSRFVNTDMSCVLIAAGSTAFCAFGYAAMTTISGYNGALALAETVLSAGASYFFCRTGKAFEHGRPIVTLSGGDRACVLMSAAIAAASLTQLTIGKISLGGILASFIVLLASKFGKESGGSIAGIASGAAVSFSKNLMSTTLSSYALGGLICGIFSVFGKIGCAVSFVLVRLIFCFLSAVEYPEFAPVYESLIASAAFMLIPEKAGSYISSIALREDAFADSATVKELILSKMGRAADGLSDIALATRKVSSAVEKERTVEMSTVLDSAAEKNCLRCSKNSECWKTKRQETIKAFYEISSAVKENKKPNPDGDFLSRCPKIELIYNDIKIKSREANIKNSAERRIKNLREVITDQFDSMALLLRDVAADAATIKSVDKKLSLAVKNVFEGRNIPLFACTCYYNLDGCLNIEVSGAKERLKNADIRSITEEISDVCLRDMSKPVKRDTENARRLIFCEKPLARAEVASVSINAAGEKFCGDCTEHFVDQYGCAHMILSDGMGSGEYAALDSMMTSGLIARMIRAGFRFGPAIKLVNSALLLKSEEESLATVDAFSINLYTGCANFYKAGAESSFVLKNKKASKVESVSLPAGILGGAEYEQSGMYLAPGDIVVLLTDGATAGGSDWILSELKYLAEKSAEDIAESLAKTANSRRTDGHTDDITVMVMKLTAQY